MNEPQRIEKLWANARYFKEGLKKLGFDTGASETPITPVMVGDTAKAQKFSGRLFGRGGLRPLHLLSDRAPGQGPAAHHRVLGAYGEGPGLRSGEVREGGQGTGHHLGVFAPARDTRCPASIQCSCFWRPAPPPRTSPERTRSSRRSMRSARPGRLSPPGSRPGPGPRVGQGQAQAHGRDRRAPAQPLRRAEELGFSAAEKRPSSRGSDERMSGADKAHAAELKRPHGQARLVPHQRLRQRRLIRTPG